MDRSIKNKWIFHEEMLDTTKWYFCTLLNLFDEQNQINFDSYSKGHAADGLFHVATRDMLQMVYSMLLQGTCCRWFIPCCCKGPAADGLFHVAACKGHAADGLFHVAARDMLSMGYSMGLQGTCCMSMVYSILLQGRCCKWFITLYMVL